MGLYDGYQLANSNRVRQYQGSVAPELVAVSQEMQKRYDAAADTQDYVSRFMNSMQALPQDQAALQDMTKGYRGRLSDLAKRPDLENTLRETTMLARDLPENYAPFAQNVKAVQDRQEELKKATEKGDLSPETANALLARDMYNYKGLQKDPNTGRYNGRFSGANYAKDINVDKKVDEWLDKALPSTQGFTTEKVGDQWIVKQHGKVVDMPQDRIQAIIRAGANSDSEFQAYAHQQQDLGTYNIDYSNLNPASLNMDGDVGSYINKTGKGSPSDIPLTMMDTVKKLVGQGESLTSAVKRIKQAQIGNDLMNRAYNYGVSKYLRHDVENDNTVTDNPYGLQKEGKKLDDQAIPIAATILQPTVASTIKDPGSLDSEIKKNDQANGETYNQYLKYINQNGIKAVGKDGKPGSPYEAGTRWYDANGVERTSEARKFIDGQLQASRASQDLQKKRQDAMRRAGYVVTPALKKQAEQAYDEAYKTVSGASGGTGGAGMTYSEEDKKQAAQNAYNDVLKNSDGYKRYQKVLSEDAEKNSVPIGITTFARKSLNDAVESNFNNLSVNLDSKGLKYGAQGLQWGSGPKTGEALEDDDYKNIAGNAKFAGVGIDTDGQYKMFFKVGTAKTDAKGNPVGKDVIVKMPAYSGIADNLVKEGQITPAQQFLAQSVTSGVSQSPTKSVILPLGDGKQVKVREVLPSEKSSLENSPGTNYIITYYGTDGREKEVTANSIDGAVSHIIGSLKKN